MTAVRKRQEVNLERLLAKAADPLLSVEGRRTEFLVEVLRSWGEPMSAAELRELLDWSDWQLRQALDHGIADGRIGTVGRRPSTRYIADPPLAPTLRGGPS